MKLDSHLRTGDILHCQGNRFISKLIRKFTKSRISHTALAIRIEGTLFIADSQRDGTHLRPFDEWQRKYKYKFFVHTYKSSYHKHRTNIVKSIALDNIGTTAYDLKSLLWYYPRYLITGKWKGKRGRIATRKFYCSEFVAYCWGLEDFYKLSPEDLKDKIDKLNQFDRYYPMGNIM